MSSDATWLDAANVVWEAARIYVAESSRLFHPLSPLSRGWWVVSKHSNFRIEQGTSFQISEYWTNPHTQARQRQTGKTKENFYALDNNPNSFSCPALAAAFYCENYFGPFQSKQIRLRLLRKRFSQQRLFAPCARICQRISPIPDAVTSTKVITAMTRDANNCLAQSLRCDEFRQMTGEEVLDVLVPSNLSPFSKAPLSVMSDQHLGGTRTWSQEVALLVERIGSSDAPVLLQGETGVGKEVIARQLHARSRRAGRPFLKLNCAALPSELVESELFGYEKGAFTGAFKSTPGKFEMANGGTILLDEIGDMDFKLQAKLLQVLQDQEFLRLGAKDTSRVNVRIMAATHCDFDQAIQEGRFREDLYYRLNIIDIQIPPLRERRDEILPLAELFLAKYATPEFPALELSPTLQRVLLEHTWPGNIRELENVMQKYLVLRNSSLLADQIRCRARKGRASGSAVRLLAMADHGRGEGGLLSQPTEPKSLSTHLVGQPTHAKSEFEPVLTAAAPKTVPIVSGRNPGFSAEGAPVLYEVQQAHQTAEAEAILQALQASFWNRKQAAGLLNIDYKALLYKMKKLGIGERSLASVRTA